MSHFDCKQIPISQGVLGPYNAYETSLRYFLLIYGVNFLSTSLRSKFFRKHIICLHLLAPKNFDVDEIVGSLIPKNFKFCRKAPNSEFGIFWV